MMKVIVCVATIGFFLTGCTGGDNATTEPVTNDQSIPSIPDSPGESGESAEKPAGAGGAGSATLPYTEKSQPNIDAAGRAALPLAGTVSTGALNVRSGPGMKFDVIKTLKKGEVVNSTECGAVWCKIGEGQYVSKKFLN